MFQVDPLKTPEELMPGLEIIAKEFPLALSSHLNAVPLVFRGELTEAGFSISRLNNGFQIDYGRKIDAFRALGRMFADTGVPALEKPCFPFLGMMLDASRGGVPGTEAIKTYLRSLALMGVNVFMLYMEDTYVVSEEPWFGYLRGAYTTNELRAVDDVAHALGIEMIPCVQTLGHLEQLLKWPEYESVKDTFHTMLVGEPSTYKLLNKMLKAASLPFRSRRIHLGLDETRDLGTGRYRDIHGTVSTDNLMAEHIAKVCEICERLDLEPMIWNDALFRRGDDAFQGYYDSAKEPPRELLDAIPDNLTLVHWDYWHHDREAYEDYIDAHRKYGYDPIVAPSPVTSARFWPAMEHARKSIAACVEASRNRRSQGLLLTVWGNDGMEVDLYSNLVMAQFMADRCHVGDNGEDISRFTTENFQATCNADYEGFIRAAHIDILPSMINDEYKNANASKWLLWDDPLLGMCEPFHDSELLTAHYSELAQELTDRATDSRIGERLLLPAQLAKVLSIKADLRSALVAAYRNGDVGHLKELRQNAVLPLIEEIELLWKTHRRFWSNTFKPFGWEVLESRYGALILRLRTLSDKLNGYILGITDSIPEFESELLSLQNKPSRSFLNVRLFKSHAEMVSACNQT